jgi:hypothetical protein
MSPATVKEKFLRWPGIWHAARARLATKIKAVRNALRRVIKNFFISMLSKKYSYVPEIKSCETKFDLKIEAKNARCLLYHAASALLEGR